MSSFGTIAFGPQGTWNIPANTDTLVPTTNWLCNSSSDYTLNAEQGAEMMPDATGSIVIPFDGSFQPLLYVDVGNDFGYSGNGTVSLVYVPKNPASESPQYTLASLNLSSAVTTGTLTNNVIANQGDLINVIWNLSTAIDVDTNNTPCNTYFNIVNTTGSWNAQYYSGTSGMPPALSQADANSVMMTSPIVNNVATFILTQCGNKTGTAIFQKEISTVTVEVQLENSEDTTLSPPARSFLLPYPADRKTVTIVFAAANTSNATWIANAVIQGI